MELMPNSNLFVITVERFDRGQFHRSLTATFQDVEQFKTNWENMPGITEFDTNVQYFPAMIISDQHRITYTEEYVP